MNFRNILLAILFIFLSNCTAGNYSVNTQKDIFKKGFSNKGFALIYDQKLYKDSLISKKIDERSLVIFQKNLKINTIVKVTNILNNKSLIAKVGYESEYPPFYNSVLSKRIADELDLNINEPYVEILEILENPNLLQKKQKHMMKRKKLFAVMK